MRNFLVQVTKRALYKAYKASQLIYKFKVDEYDFMTIEIMKKYLKKDYNCIDIGANYGFLLHYIVSFAPKGKHYAFEPITPICNLLKKKYGRKVNVQNIALSDTNGQQEFFYYENRPAVSGLKAREHMGGNHPTKLTVQTARLDDLMPPNEKIHLIKMDVEGAELLVLKGATQLLTAQKPLILFECGPGGLDHFGHTPEEMFDLLESCGLHISLIEYYRGNLPPLSKDEFCGQYYKGYNYFFVAHP